MLAMPKECTSVTVKVQTLLLGEVEVPEDKLVTFVTPMLGFNHLKRFYLYQTKEGPLFWLQALEETAVSFCLLSPFATALDPDMEITADEIADITDRGVDDIDVYTVLVLDNDPNELRTNLRAPILIGRSSGKAKQIVLTDTRLPIKFYLRDAKPRP